MTSGTSKWAEKLHLAWTAVGPVDIQKYSQQVAQLWQRDCASSIDDFKGRVNLRLNFRLKVTFCASAT